MGIIEAIFSKVDVVAVIVFMFSTLLVTSGLRGLLSRVIWFCRALENNFFKIALSWLVGALVFIFALPVVFHDIRANDLTILQFIFWTLVLNGGYKLVTFILKAIKEFKEIR